MHKRIGQFERAAVARVADSADRVRDDRGDMDASIQA